MPSGQDFVAPTLGAVPSGEDIVAPTLGAVPSGEAIVAPTLAALPCSEDTVAPTRDVQVSGFLSQVKSKSLFEKSKSSLYIE
jgi:hypothetical protein